MVNAGFGTHIAPDRVVAIMAPDSAPIRRAMRRAEEAGRLFDVTYGRKERSVVRMDNGDLIVTSLAPETLAQRIDEARRATGGGAR